MTMNRSSIIRITLESVFPIVFLVFFFVLTSNRGTSTWIAFGAVFVAYFALLITPSLVRSGRASTDYRRPLFVISGLYFLIAFFLNCGILFAQPVSTRFAALSNIALLAVYFIFLFVNLLVNENTGDQEDRRGKEIDYVKVVPLRLRLLKNRLKDPEVSGMIDKVAEIISYSPARSSASVHQVEERILQELDKLETILPTDSAGVVNGIELISTLAKERNAILNKEN